jgi:hypothetical protein
MTLEQVGKSTAQVASRICVRRRREREAVKKALEVWRRRDKGRQDVKDGEVRKVEKNCGQVVEVKLLPREESKGWGRVNVPVSVAVARPPLVDVDDGVEVDVEVDLFLGVEVEVGRLVEEEEEEDDVGSSNCRRARFMRSGRGGGALRSKRRSLGKRSLLAA